MSGEKRSNTLAGPVAKFMWGLKPDEPQEIPREVKETTKGYKANMYRWAHYHGKRVTIQTREDGSVWAAILPE